MSVLIKKVLNDHYQEIKKMKTYGKKKRKQLSSLFTPITKPLHSIKESKIGLERFFDVEASFFPAKKKIRREGTSLSTFSKKQSIEEGEEQKEEEIRWVQSYLDLGQVSLLSPFSFS